MRPLSLALSWVAFVAIGSEGAPQDFIPPELIERICQENEAKYSGPPMPRISAPTFSGRGCPSPESRIGYNYVGKWSCHRKYDVQFVIPGLRLRAEGGDVVKADCAITFRVDELGEGYQLALDEGILDVDVELSRGSEVRFVGAASWEGGVKTNGLVMLGQNWYDRDIAQFKPFGARISYRGLYNEYSPCSRANGVVGNLTVKYNIELDASNSTGYASLESGSLRDTQTGKDIDDAATLNLKWLIKACGS